MNETNVQQQNNHCTGLWDDQMALSYDNQWGEHPMHQKVVELCKLGRSAVVVDIGCGSGTVVREIARHLSAGKVTGVDPTSKMIELAQQRTHRQDFNVDIDYVITGAEQLPFVSQSIDLAVAVNSLHHWRNVVEGLVEIYRVLRSEGQFVIIDELWDELPADQKPQCDDPQTAAHINAFKSTAVIINALESAGFVNITKQIYRAPEVAVSVITAVRVSE